MKEDNKARELLKRLRATIIVLCIPLVIFVIYLFIGFLDWISNDPLDLLTEPTIYISPYQKDIDDCRAKGGYPNVSGWNGRLKECNFIK